MRSWWQVADAERRDSLGVVWRNWHPGPLLFQTVADSLGARAPPLAPLAALAAPAAPA